MNLRKPVFDTLIDTLNQFQYCILRNYEILPEYNNDIDILIDKNHKQQAIDALESAFQKIEVFKLQQVEFSSSAVFFFDKTSKQFIHIDFLSSIKWRVFEYLDVESVLRSRLPYRNFFIPAPQYECLELLLTRLVYQGKIKDVYKDRIFEHANQIDLNNFDIDDFYKSLLQKARANKWGEIESQLIKLRAYIIWKNLLKPIALSKNIYLFLNRAASRIFKSPGLFIAFYGVDGSGKSTQIATLQERLKGMYADKIRRFHFRPSFVYQVPKNVPMTDPHDQPPANIVRSILKLFYYVFIYHWGYWTQVKPMLAINGLVIFDRYFQDIQVDPRRYRYNGPVWLVKLFARLLPQPDLVILLDAPEDIIYSRKREVALEELKQQRKKYQQLMASVSDGCIINTTGAIEQVCDELIEIVVAQIIEKNNSESLEKMQINVEKSNSGEN
jgi:thymidylate kinase